MFQPDLPAIDTDSRVNPQHLRLLEAILFASAEPLPQAQLASRLPDGADVSSLLQELAALYTNRGVNLVRVGSDWAFRTAPDLAPMMRTEVQLTRKLSRAAIETLAIIAYHQPVTRAEIEEIRGVAMSKGTLDILLEAGWIRPKGRRRTPGRPVVWCTTGAFLDHFGLESLEALPGIEELKAAGLIDSRPAVTILGAAGQTPGDVDRPASEDEDSTEDGEPLPVDFGDDLLPRDDDADVVSPQDGLASDLPTADGSR
jgi:segregation and condensation protein B